MVGAQFVQAPNIQFIKPANVPAAWWLPSSPINHHKKPRLNEIFITVI